MGQEDRLIFLISKVYQKLMTALKKSLQQEGLDITPVQGMVLFFLHKNNGCSLTELSRGIMIENATVTGLVDRLEKSGCVERRSNQDDRRAYRIYLTEKGHRVARESLPVVKKVNDEIKAGYSQEEVDAFKKVLTGALHKFK